MISKLPPKLHVTLLKASRVGKRAPLFKQAVQAAAQNMQ